MKWFRCGLFSIGVTMLCLSLCSARCSRCVPCAQGGFCTLGSRCSRGWQDVKCRATRSLRLRGGDCGSYHGEDESDGIMTYGGDGPVHDCHLHEHPPCRESDMRLWTSVAEGDVDGARQALDDGADVNAINQYDSVRAAIHYAVSNRNMSCMRCDVSTMADGDPACMCRQQLVADLIRAGADTLQPCALGTRAIHLAAATGSLAAVRSLVQSGVNVNISDGSRRGPLHFSAVGFYTVHIYDV